LKKKGAVLSLRFPTSRRHRTMGVHLGSRMMAVMTQIMMRQIRTGTTTTTGSRTTPSHTGHTLSAFALP